MKKLTWADFGLGVWLLGFPILFGYSMRRGLILGETILPGLFLVITSILILSRRSGAPLLSWTQEICALWLIVGSFVLMFYRLSSASLDGLVVGFLIFGLNVAFTRPLQRERAA